MALPAQRINLATNPSFETASGTVNVRTNLCTNPNPTTGASWSTSFGSGGAGTVAYGAVSGFPTANGSTSTFTASPSAGWNVQTGVFTGITAGQSVTGSLYGKHSWAGGTACLTFQFFDASDVSLGYFGAAQQAIPANTVTRISQTMTAPANATKVALFWDAQGAPAIQPPVNGVAVIGAPLLEMSSNLGTFFYGSTPAAGDFTYAWSGTANASTSYQQAPGVEGLESKWAGTDFAGFQSSARTPLSGAKNFRVLARRAQTFLWGTTAARAVTVTAGETITVSCSVNPSVTKQFRMSTGFNAGATVYPAFVSCPANTWTRLSSTFVVPAGATLMTVYLNSEDLSVAGSTYDFDQFLIEKTDALQPYFDGNTTDPNYTHAWTGAVNASTSTRDVYGIWVEQVTGAGAPRVQVTAIGLGGTAVTTQVTRKAGRETWSVPGWKKRNTLNGETYTDWTPPLGRPVTYTLISNGLTINTMTITVTSTTGWVQDPLNPESAMPVETTADGGPAILALSKAALKRLSYGAVYEEETPLGGQYPIVRANDRQGASGVEFHLNAYSNVTSDALQQLVMDTPIILFRGLPSWGSIPALAYLVGDVEEAPFNRARGGQFTAWVAAGKLAAPVALGPLTGSVTNQMVQDNLAGRTNASIQSTSATKRNIDVQANPLGLGQ